MVIKRCNICAGGHGELLTRGLPILAVGHQITVLPPPKATSVPHISVQLPSSPSQQAICLLAWLSTQELQLLDAIVVARTTWPFHANPCHTDLHVDECKRPHHSAGPKMQSWPQSRPGPDAVLWQRECQCGRCLPPMGPPRGASGGSEVGRAACTAACRLRATRYGAEMLHWGDS